MIPRPILTVLMITALLAALPVLALATPAIVATTPANGAVDIPVTTTVTATFSEAMDPVTITGNNVTLARFVGVKAVATGFAHTVVLKNDGTVAAWGDNSAGQTAVPAGLSGVTAIAAGEAHTVVLKGDGTVVAWGRNDNGQITIPAGLTGVTAVAAGFGHTVALKSDGSVAAWGLNSSGQATVPAGLTGVVAIATGNYHTVALKNDGTVVAWGRNLSGQTAVPAGLTGVTRIAAGWYHTLALKNDGTVVAWGESRSGQTTVPEGVTAVTGIAAGAYHSVAQQGSTVVAWGWNKYGATTVPAGLTGVTAVTAGGYQTEAIMNDGTLVVWGRNDKGQITIPGGTYLGNVAGAVAYDALNNTMIFTPATPLPTATTLTATVSSAVRSLAGVTPASDYSWAFTTASPYTTLTVTLAGSGNGSVHDDAGVIACAGGKSDICGNTYAGGPVVKLIASPDWKSMFSSWSGDCTGNGDCTLDMSRSRTVQALFDANKQSIVNGNAAVGFATLQQAYRGAVHKSVIQVHAATFYEDLILDEAKEVTFDGGKDPSDALYRNTTGVTEVQGSLTITDGTATFNNFVIQ